jgi:calcium-dependent protein kinase
MGCCQSGINREEPNIESNFEGYSSRNNKENEKSNTGGDSAPDPQALGPQDSKFEETSVISKPHEKKSSGKKKRGKSKKNSKIHTSNDTDKLIDQKPIDLKISKSNFVKTTKGLLKDRYIITGKLGSGSYGNVYKAIQKSTKTLRAIKSLSKRDIKTDISKLIQEVEMLKKLDHPNIIKVIEVIEENDYMHIVTELCSGGELFDRIVSMRHFTENKAAHYMLNIMSAVAYCHQAGIVHRDLKPENLLLENEKDDAPLKVIDFGESMSFGPDKKMHKRIGTVRFI